MDGAVIDPVTDFPPDANCLEAYEIEILVRQGLNEQTGSSAPIQVEIYDHQWPDTIESVWIEAPDLFTGMNEFTETTVNGEDCVVFTGTLTNELGASYGDYPLLVRVIDEESDQNLGAIDAWQLVSVGIHEGWVRTWGGILDERGYSVAIDGSDYLYTTGYFRETVDFDPGPGIDEQVPPGDHGAFLSKIDTSGNFIWARTWGSDFTTGNASKVDSLGNVYNTGRFDETCDFDPGPGIEERTSNGDRDVYLSKFNSAGDFLWVRTWGGINEDESNAIAVDSSDNVYVTGWFRKTVDFDPGPGVDQHTALGFTDIYLIKFDPDGEFLWVLVWGTDAGFYWDEGRDVYFDGIDSIYVSGNYTKPIDLDPGPGIDMHEAYGARDAFISKFNTTGEYQWGHSWGSTGSDYGWTVSADASGNVYVAGPYDNTVDFDPGPGIEERTHDVDGSGYLSKFDSDGEFQWVWTYRGHSMDLAIGGSGNIYLCGYYIPSLFVCSLTQDGVLLWHRVLCGGASDFAHGICVDEYENVYFVGDFSGTDDFDPGPSVEHHTSNGDDDVFLCKFKSDGWW